MAANTTDQNLQKLQEQLHKGAEETKSYLASLKEKLAEYDEHYKVSETASSYLDAAIDRTHKSVDEMKALGETIKQQSRDKSGAAVDAAKASFEKVQAALESLKTTGREYDQKFKNTVTSSVSSAKDGVVSASTTVSTSIEHIVVATREKTSSSFEQLKETLASYGHEAVVVTGTVVAKAEQLDERYGVIGTISGAVAAVTSKVADLDKSLGVSETASKVDEKITGGIGATLLNKGVELVNSSVEYVSEALQNAKTTAATEAEGTKPSSATKTVEEVTPTP